MKIGNLEVYGVIYKIENLVNDKVYIGQTTDEKGFDGRYNNDLEKNTHNEYLKRSIHKYGILNFRINKILDIAFSKNELNIKEDLWISIYNSTNSLKGYNLTSGGSFGEFNEDYRQHMRESQKSIPIIQLDFDGNIIKTWEHGSREASKKLNYSQTNIWKCCNKIQASYKGCIWLYLHDYKENGVDLYWHENNSRFKRIVQLDVDNHEIVKVWNNLKDIDIDNKNIDRSAIVKVCKDKLASACGYRWMYYIDYLQGKKNQMKTSTKRVNKLLNNTIIKTYFSVMEASRDIKGCDSSIRDAIYNNKLYKGYKWAYV